MQIHIDRDWPTDTPCKYHCSPSCHPAQMLDDDWKHGCLHVAWEQNKYDFCPIVECGGDPEKCEIERWLLTKSPEKCEIERWLLTKSEEVELFGK